MKRNSFDTAFFLVVLYVLFLIIYAIVISSCNTPKHATRNIAKWQAKQPQTVAEACGLYYPPIEKVEVKERMVKGKTDTIKSVVKVDCDTVTARYKGRRVVSVPCHLQHTAPIQLS